MTRTIDFPSILSGYTTGSLLKFWGNYQRALDNALNPVYAFQDQRQFQSTVPGTHKPEKEPLSLQIEREMMRQLKKAASMQGVPVSELVKEVLAHRFGHIRLTEEDHEDISHATRQAKREGRRIATPYFPEDGH